MAAVTGIGGVAAACAASPIVVPTAVPATQAPAETLKEFVGQLETHLTPADRMRILSHQALWRQMR